MSSNAPKEAAVDTCDQCRARKVKCILPSGEAGPSSPLKSDDRRAACQSCKRRDEPCTFDYRYKKSGRPKGSYAKRTSTTTRSPSPNKRQRIDHGPLSFETPPTFNQNSNQGISPLFSSHGPSQTQDATAQNSPYDNYGPTFGSIFGSARLALDPPPTLSFNYNLPYDHQSPFPQVQAAGSNAHIDTSSLSMGSANPTGGDGWLPIEPLPRDTGPTLSTDPHVPFPQIVTFATWEAVGFFLSLHMRHQHVLTPLVHQPSFARDLLHRRDVHDEPFRGLLLSIVAYTICQVPMHTLLDQMSRPELESLCRRCQRGSRAIQIRYQMRPNKITLASTVFDWISSQAIGRDALRDALMSDIRRLIYSLGLHLPNPPGAPSSIDVEIGRRLFWEAYACDKTNALNGHQVNLPDFEGTPPLPLEVDDEYITAESILSQPTSRQSFMSGFIAISRVFQILSQAIMRQRTLQMNHKAGPDRNTLLNWIGETTEELRGIMEKLPPLLRHEYGRGDDGEVHSIYATQQANIHITALCVELYLLEFKAAIAQEEDLVINRKAIAEKAFKQLSTIPIDCIASNGESMRGKVLRVILALLDEDNSQQFSSELWDWWNMYSRVQFLQVIPEGVNAATAPQSPQASG